MGRVRPNLGTPYGTDAPWLAALVEVVSDLYDLLDARLPASASAGGGEPGTAGPVRVSEPAPDGPLAGARPVVEPAVDSPADDGEDDDGPVKVTEPAPDRASLPPAPPRAGRGSGTDSWQAFANIAGVNYPKDATRNDIIAACVRAGVIDAD